MFATLPFFKRLQALQIKIGFINTDFEICYFLSNVITSIALKLSFYNIFFHLMINLFHMKISCKFLFLYEDYFVMIVLRKTTH